MKALVKKYNSVNEYTFVEAGDEVMYYSEVGYETFATVIEVLSNPKGWEHYELIVQFENDDDGVDKDHVAMKAVNAHSENEMTLSLFSEALLTCDFSIRTSKLPHHARTKLSDGSDAHFFIEDAADYDDSYSAVLRELLVAREWENQRI